MSHYFNKIFFFYPLVLWMSISHPLSFTGQHYHCHQLIARNSCKRPLPPVEYKTKCNLFATPFFFCVAIFLCINYWIIPTLKVIHGAQFLQSPAHHFSGSLQALQTKSTWLLPLLSSSSEHLKWNVVPHVVPLNISRGGAARSLRHGALL